MFVTATRKKFRFDTRAGQLSVEDLWDLPLTSQTKPNLDSIAQDLYRKLRDEEISFVNQTKKNADIETKLEIVKFIIEAKKKDAEAIRVRAENAARRQTIANLIAQKELGQLQDTSLDDLKAMLSSIPE